MAKKGKLPTPELVLDREMRAFEMRCQNKTQKEIAETLQLTQPGVCEILQRVQRKYYNHFLEDINAVKLDQLARHEQIKKELWTQWELTGDVAIVEQIRKFDADARKMLGADAPTRTINTDVDVSKLSEEELRSIVNFESKG